MKICIVVPCRNEVKYIEECIRAIYAAEGISAYELDVNIVDGMSDDGTRERVSVLMNEFPSLHLVDNEKQLTPFAFNLGIHACEGADYYQIIGARHIISKNYLSNCIRKLSSDSDTWCVGGRIVNEYINETGEVIARAMGTTFGMGLGNFRTLTQSGYTDTVTSPMYPAWVFDKIGYFDEELVRNQDDDFNYRITKEGGKIYYDAEIYLRYYVRGNFKGLWRQFFQYGYWKVYVNKKHKAVTTLRQLVPPLFVAYLFLLLLIFFISSMLFALAVIPLVFYLLLALVFSLKSAGKEINPLRIFIVFPILHLSYGLGYLKGMWEFLLMNRKPSDKQKRMSR